MTITYTLDNTIENSEMATVVFPRLTLPGSAETSPNENANSGPAAPSLGVTLQPYQILTPSVGAVETFSCEGRLTFQAATVAKAPVSEGGSATMASRESSPGGITPLVVFSPVIQVFEGDIYQLQVLPGEIIAKKTGSTSDPAITIENPPQGSVPPIPVTVTWSLDLVPFCTMTPVAGPIPAILTLGKGLFFMPVSSLKIPSTYPPSQVLKSATSYIPPLSSQSIAAVFRIKPKKSSEEAPGPGDSNLQDAQTEGLEHASATAEERAPETGKTSETAQTRPNPPAKGNSSHNRPDEAGARPNPPAEGSIAGNRPDEAGSGTDEDAALKTEYVFRPLSASE